MSETEARNAIYDAIFRWGRAPQGLAAADAFEEIEAALDAYADALRAGRMDICSETRDAG